jgi:STE24 endopeptidase
VASPGEIRYAPNLDPGAFCAAVKILLRCASALVLFAVLGGTALADAPIARDLPPGLHVPEGAMPGPGFDAEKATEAWLAILSPEQRALSDSYFEGGYWLRLFGTLYAIAVMAALLVTGTSRRLRDLALRASRRPWINVALYAAGFIVLVFVLELPFTIYTGYFREHAYGLATQTFPRWTRDRLVGLAVSLAIGPIVVSLLYAGVRRAGRRWWIWATGFAFAYTLLINMIYPVFIAPLFNDYKPLPEGDVRNAVMSLARANGIPTEHVEWFDASRQTTRVSANVSGIAGLARINLNDNLLNKTSLPEIRAVLAHEMGHYVLNHSIKLAVTFTLIYGLAFAIMNGVFDRALARWGPRLGLRDRTDPAALPLVAAILIGVMFLLTPITNTVIRGAETEADTFGLNAAREPQGFAMSAMRLSTYRKLKPGPFEEFIFYDHPSGYERVHQSMVWLKENL